MTTSFALDPIGHVRGGRAEATDDDWGSVDAVIALDADRFGSEALQGLDKFSHAEIIFVFDRVAPETVTTAARRPPDWPEVGIFAQRTKNRPNRLGLTTCEIIAVAGAALHVRGLDAIDGTPVLDIKPVMSGFAPRKQLREPGWARAIMAQYW